MSENLFRSKGNKFKPVKNTLKLVKKHVPPAPRILEEVATLQPKDLTATKEDEKKLEASHLQIALNAQESLNKRNLDYVDAEKLSKIATNHSEAYVKFKEASAAGFQQAPPVQVLIQLNTILQNLPPMPENFIEIPPK